MSETKKVVTEDVAVSDLPEKVRGDFKPDDLVSVTLEQPAAPVPRHDALKYAGIGAYMNTSIEEAVARVREWRDDWD
jgi:hypothetical protein